MRSILSSSQLPRKKVNRKHLPSKRANRPPFVNVVNDNQILIYIFVFVLLLTSSASAIIFTILGAICFTTIFLGIFLKQLINNNFQNSLLHKIKNVFTNEFSKLLIFLFISSFFVDDEIFLLLLFIFSTITATLYQFYAKQAVIQNNPQKKTKKKTKNTIQKKIKPSPTPSQSLLKPLDINKDSQHLRLMLSAHSVIILEELINTMNELQHHLEYLQQHHAYLANSVQELITDITNNTVHRLDKVAKSFVNNGQVKEKARKIFAESHEEQIIELFYHHIAEIKALNESIMEKQMAGFSQTGTEKEMQFRDTIMELKILLRWYIAQQPDELTANSHQVILDNLQKSTLQQMMTAFYDVNTTDSQRKQLQEQINQLVSHFKGDTQQDILAISQQKNSTIPSTFLQKQSQENMATQEFIDFNEHYVQQLKQHW